MTGDIDLLERLSGKHAAKSRERHEAWSYYDAEYRVQALGVNIPPEMRDLLGQVGWPRLFLDSLEHRLDHEGFRLGGQANANEELQDWWGANNLDVESSLVHLGSLIYGDAYVTISRPDPEDPDHVPGVPVIRGESPESFYAEEDPRTRQIKWAVRLYESEDVAGIYDGATLFVPGKTVNLRREDPQGQWKVINTVNTGLKFVPVVRFPNRPTLDNRRGQSEITPELRSITDAASRLMMNLHATAELMAIPQRVLFGVARDALADPDNPNATMDLYTARILTFEDQGQATQFSAAELMNFVNGLQELAKHAAAYTGLPPQYLSFSSENPASADAIRASESRLVKTSERKQKVFGDGWERVMRTAYLVMSRDLPEGSRRMESIWRNAATPTYAAKADAVSKLVATPTPTGEPLIPIEQARIDLGYSPETRRQMREWGEGDPIHRISRLYADEAPAQNGDDDE